jgi:lipooligosaccharide transport system permease protein
MQKRRWNLQLISAVWERNYWQFVRSWKISVLWVILEPLLIPDIQGVSYIEFYFPGLVCNSALLISFFVATYDNFAKCNYLHIFSAQSLTPLEPHEITLGEILWASTKGLVGVISLLLFAYFIGVIPGSHFAPSLLFGVAAALFGASFGFWTITWAQNYEHIVYPTSGLIVPMTLVCGTYFPMDQYPAALKFLVYILPHTHLVNGLRNMLSDQVPVWNPLLLLYPLALSFIIMGFAVKRLEARLIQ